MTANALARGWLLAAWWLLATGAAGAAGTVAAQPAVAAGAQSTTPAAPRAKAVFAGGCFWCVQSDFDPVPGVISTTAGYTGGQTVNPSYEEVSAEHSGHAEAVEIVFDPRQVSYRTLVDRYWRTIDPTTKDRQFCDVGSSYRTAIFAQDAAQLKEALASRDALEQTKPFAAPIVTEIVMAGPFYRAEEYHQSYYRKNPLRYRYYRLSCGRDARLKELWGAQAAVH